MSGEERPPAGPGARDDRADALARSRHARLDGVPEPLADFDPERAAALCAAVCREALGDFAPALLLLPVTERARLQAVVAYARTLFDFAADPGVEGERLAQINRWQFALESALGGERIGQPVDVAMAREHARRAWPEGALDGIATAARRRVTQPRLATVEAAERQAEQLAAAVGEALLGAPPPAEAAAFGGALLRLHALQHLGEAVAANRWPLAASELAAADREPSSQPPAAVLAAARREAERLRPRLLAASRAVAALPPEVRRAAAFALLAALALLARVEEADEKLLALPPRLGLLARLALLARARWLWLSSLTF
ncbi:MAG TPA: squalene/phytoene synthase family protein [Thermoanaerobaculia bacterium]